MKAFLSHSSKDKDFVRMVARVLGELQVEFDERTFEYEFNVAAIRHALQRSDIFVYFLSKNSVTSTFVKEEASAALEARGRGVLQRVMIFAIDETSYKALPEWMRDINVVQQMGSAKACGRQIQAALLELAAKEDPGLALYLGREADLAELRRALAVPPGKTPIYLHAIGYYGIGRRTFLSKSLKELFPRLYSTFVEIGFAGYEGAEELYRRLYALHKVASLEETGRDLEAFSKLDLQGQVGGIVSILKEMASNGEFVIIIDSGGVYSDEGRYQPLFEELLKQLDSIGRPCLGFVQTRMMPLSVRHGFPRTFHQYLKGLADDVVKDLVSLSLKELQVEFTEAQVAAVVQHLDGHPYNVRFAVQYILNYGIDTLVSDPTDLIEWKNRRAVDFLVKLEFDDVESDIVALLSEYQYLASATLIEALGGDGAVAARASRRLQEYCCIELREGYFQLAPPLRDAVRRDVRFKRDDKWKQEVALLICELVETYKGEGQVPLQIIESATLVAARSDNPPGFLATFILPSYLLRVAREHYDAGRRSACLRFCERAFGQRDRLPMEAQIELLRLWGLSAIRLTRQDVFASVVSELRKFNTKFARRMIFFLEGFHARLRGSLDEAEEKFLKAWNLARRNESINRELASLYCKERRYADAEAYARAAYEIAPTNPFILDILAETLLGKAHAGLPVDREELARVLDQLKIYGDAPGSSFFLIREAQQKLRDRKSEDALQLIERAVDRTPDLLAPYFIRADIHLSSGDIGGAVTDLKEIDRILTNAGGFSEGDEAAAQELKVRIMLEKRQFKAAKNELDMAAFLPRLVRKRLLQQLARAVGFEPENADPELREWAKSYSG